MRRTLTATILCFGLAIPAWGQDTPPEDTASPDTPSPDAPAIDPTLIGPTTDWDVCNETSYVLRTASAFLRGGRMVAKGWDEILPGSCITLVTPVDSPRFLYAESAPVHRGGVREWRGETPLCVDDTDFESDATEDCRLARRQSRNYFAVRPGEPVTTLVEPASYTPEKAVIAAQQRLLRDAGYEISRVDGLSGRDTFRVLRQFRRDTDLAATVDGEPLLRAMMQRASETSQTVGLEVCNESSANVWAAVATRENGTWRSRGWWRTAPESCTKPIDVALPGTEAHVFAVQEQEDGADRRLRTVATTPAQFCISEARFDALGNEMCVEKGYNIANFRPVPTDADGARMRLSDSDFVEAAPGGLRR